MNINLLKEIIRKNPEVLKEMSEENKVLVLDALLQEAAWPKTKTYMSMWGISLGGFVGWGIYRALRASMGKCTRKCGTYEINTVRRQVCRIKCKIDNIVRLVTELEKSKAPKEYGDSEKFEIKKRKAIVKIKKQLPALHKKLDDYQKRAKKRGTEY
jgi:hypothetical protein